MLAQSMQGDLAHCDTFTGRFKIWQQCTSAIFLVPNSFYVTVPGSIPEQGSPALAAMVAEVEDKRPKILGEKAQYVIDASGQKGEVPSLITCLSVAVGAALLLHPVLTQLPSLHRSST